MPKKFYRFESIRESSKKAELPKLGKLPDDVDERIKYLEKIHKELRFRILEEGKPFDVKIRELQRQRNKILEKLKRDRDKSGIELMKAKKKKKEIANQKKKDEWLDRVPQDNNEFRLWIEALFPNKKIEKIITPKVIGDGVNIFCYQSSESLKHGDTANLKYYFAVLDNEMIGVLNVSVTRFKVIADGVCYGKKTRFKRNGQNALKPYGTWKEHILREVPKRVVRKMEEAQGWHFVQNSKGEEVKMKVAER